MLNTWKNRSLVQEGFFFLILGEEWPDKVNRLRNWMGDSAEINIVTALDETACE